MIKLLALLLSIFLSTGCTALLKKTDSPKDNTTKHQALQKANILNNQGVDAYKKGDYKKAIAYYHQSIAIKEKILGSDDLNTATSYNNLGLIYKKMKEYPKALAFLTKALEVRKRFLGQNSSKTAESYNNIGTLYASMGETQKAIDLTEHTIGIKQEIRKKENLDIAISYTNLAVLEELQGHNAKAIEHHKKALEINKENFGDEHDLTQNNYKHIAQLYFATQQYQKAKEYAQHITKEDAIALEDIDVIEDYPVQH